MLAFIRVAFTTMAMELKKKKNQVFKIQVGVFFLLEVLEDCHSLWEQEAILVSVPLMKGNFFPWYSLIGTVALAS